jgi:hypothetical protein
MRHTAKEHRQRASIGRIFQACARAYNETLAQRKRNVIASAAMSKKVWTPSEMGKKGGRSTSPAKVRAAQRNAIISAVKRALRKKEKAS